MPYYKLIQCGHVLEVYKYDKAPVNFSITHEEENKPDPEKEWIYETEKTSKEDYSRYNANVRRNKLRRMILANFNENSKFITLTFKENVTDLDIANKEFKKFIQRMKQRFDDFKYLAVIEFQKRGAVHYHMISDLPFIQKGLLYSLWQNRKISRSKKSNFYCIGEIPSGCKQGFVKINNISHVDNVGAYIVKYMTKESDNPLLENRKTYLYSKNLIKETVITGDTAESIIESMDLNYKDPVYQNEYETEFLGMARYKEYNLKRMGLE